MSNFYERNVNSYYFLGIFKTLINDGCYHWADTGFKYYRKDTPDGETPFLIVAENDRAYNKIKSITTKAFHSWVGKPMHRWQTCYSCGGMKNYDGNMFKICECKSIE